LNQGESHVVLFIENRSEFKVSSSLSTYKMRIGEKVGLVSTLHQNEKRSVPFNKLKPYGSVELAEMNVNLPNGMTKVVRMKDDGLNSDFEANDNIYGASFTPDEPGHYTSQVSMKGRTHLGVPFIRTTQHIFNVIPEDFDLEKNAFATIEQDEVVIELILVSKRFKALGKRYKAYAEVWGTNDEKSLIPIAWVGGMSLVESQGGYLILPLRLNLRWISKAKANSLVMLKNVYVQEPNSNVPIANQNHILLRFSSNSLNLKLAISSFPFEGEITEPMKIGHRPEKYQFKNKKNGEAKLLLVHGYCASLIPFSNDSFTNFAVFSDLNQNRAHDEFALKLRFWAEQFTEGYSIVSHSQGGIASLQLLTFYWGNHDLLSNSKGKRRLQTLGTPFKGSSLAGSVAAIGKRVGFGCGSNADLTPDGAKLWRLVIPKEVRKQVYYHVSVYPPNSWCSFPAQAILQWPNGLFFSHSTTRWCNRTN
jgi:hypothetical protein